MDLGTKASFVFIVNVGYTTLWQQNTQSFLLNNNYTFARTSPFGVILAAHSSCYFG